MFAYATGRIAEERLGDPSLAVAEYTRALLMRGDDRLASGDALFSRARCRAQLGDLAEARADLRLLLHVDPSSAARGEVRALATRLAVAL